MFRGLRYGLQVTLLICCFCWTIAAQAAEPEMHVHFLDQGQASSALLEFPCGAILIDTGGQDDESPDELADSLRDFFARRTDLNHTLNAVVITHPHIDHTRGIQRVLQTCRVNNFIYNGFVRGSGKEGIQYAIDNAATHNLNVISVADTDVTAAGYGLTNGDIDPIQCTDCDPEIRILSGGLQQNPGWQDRDFDNLNNHSLVVRVDFGKSSLLFTGDLEEPALETLVAFYKDTDLLDVDAYLVGHHGSKNGTIQSLVDAMSPEVAVISVGIPQFGQGRQRGFNTFSYGHPNRDVIEMLSNAISGERERPMDVRVGEGGQRFSLFQVTKHIYATGWDGQITLSCRQNGSIHVTTRKTDEITPAVSPASSQPTAMLAAIPVGMAPMASPTAAPASTPYHWNQPPPVKTPTTTANGKSILFDVSHGGTQGNADWVIDGGFSDFADALAAQGYEVKEYRGVDKDQDGIIRFFDDRTSNTPENEAIIDFDAIKDSDVFVLAESNRPFREDERAALERYVAAGKGLLFIGDHYNADRNLNSWDATEVFNGYNRSTEPDFDMGSPYGDLRNPGSADAGWLVEQFGIRFRFNAINCLAGASDIVAPNDAENLTVGATPILMAASATLAVVEPDRAKGLIYLADSDPAKSWGKAIEGANNGLYFGGRDEGPLVAISKSGAGKAAFFGDSSPIEDITPKYRDERGGTNKPLHNGWNNGGSAKVIMLNIVDWLATPESYTHFDGANGHAPGIKTPNAMAPIEQDDPADGRPWSQPSGNYDPWDSDTFAPGSYGAPFPSDSGAGHHGGGSSPTTTVGVSDALGIAEGTLISVQGKIVAEHNDQYGLQLADPQNPSIVLYVQLPQSQRAVYAPKLNPGAIGKSVVITGTRGKYTGLPGIRGVRSITDVP
ncbi:MBL fold metallo-hydrolase [Bremerella cremea]|uniref:MBL fold metallo-hydrolase n=1 Tax=Bremerella cremea TaxID=1031537 RepID=UPI0031E97FDB